MECPNCTRVNPDSALRCVCGYVFIAHTLEPSREPPDQALSNEIITKERNIYLVGFLLLVVIGVFFKLLALGGSPDAIENIQGIGAIGTLVGKGIFVYLAFRLSRFLRQPVWLTALYCILTPFALLYLIPFVGLLIGVKKARRTLVSGN